MVATLKTFEVNLEILRDNNPRKRKLAEGNKGKSKDNKASSLIAIVTVSMPKQSG